MYNFGMVETLPIGKELEDEVSFVMKKIGVSKIGSKEDKEQGTDIVIYGVPCDITCDYYGKDHMEKLPKVLDLKHIRISYGVRTGNNHNGFTKFDIPVLVIGIDAPIEYVKNYFDTIIDDIKRNLDEVVDMGQSQYFDWCDLNGVEI